MLSLPRAQALIFLLVACAPEPVDWSEAQPFPAAPADGQLLTVDATGRPATLPLPRIAAPADSTQCTASVRVAGSPAVGWYAVWWALRPDSTANLVVARSGDAAGGAWGRAVRVDTADVGRIGCRRPPPSIAADGDNVHVAYAMTAREGPGIFASHSMDRGAMFHTPVVVVYGGADANTAIAARGDQVAIAYEDPNSRPTRIGVTYSRTQAHGFAWRGIVSSSSDAARSPGIALGDGRIAVTWLREPRGEGQADTVRMLRLGTLR